MFNEKLNIVKTEASWHDWVREILPFIYIYYKKKVNTYSCQALTAEPISTFEVSLSTIIGIGLH